MENSGLHSLACPTYFENIPRQKTSTKYAKFTPSWSRKKPLNQKPSLHQIKKTTFEEFNTKAHAETTVCKGNKCLSSEGL